MLALAPTNLGKQNYEKMEQMHDGGEKTAERHTVFLRVKSQLLL